MRARGGLKILVFSILAVLALGVRPAETARRALEGTVEQLLELDVRPFAIGHRGFGDNLGEDPSRPLENTVPAVRAGFKAGVSVVEVDVQLTRDGEVAVFHDDFLPDFTCINSLTLSALRERLPHIPSLQAVLNQAKKFNQSSGPLRGLVLVELKAAAPLCDPDDTREDEIVSAVVRVIRRMEMTDQVMLASFSPALLSLAATEAPDIARILTISGLQFLTAQILEAVFGYLPTPIEKKLDVGLQWAEIGPIFRLPGYRSIGEVLSTAAVIGARVVEADLLFFGSLDPDDVEEFVAAVHGFGLKLFGFTADNEADWIFLQSLGVDGIYANDVPLGATLQAPIP